MPNIWIEYTANLKGEARIPELFEKMSRHLLAFDGGGIFPPGGTRFRAQELTEYYMADGKDDYAYVHVTASIGPSRPDEQMRRAFDEVFDIVKDHFREPFERRLLAIYMEVQKADPDWTWRHNNVHRKFQAKAEAPR